MDVGIPRFRIIDSRRFRILFCAGANIALGIVDDLMKDPEFKQAESVVFSGIRFCFILLKFFFCIFVWVSNFAVAVLEASEY